MITARRRSLGQGSVFTPVCQSFGSGGGVCIGEVCIQGGLPPRGRWADPPSDTMGYGKRVCGTHPTGFLFREQI